MSLIRQVARSQISENLGCAPSGYPLDRWLHRDKRVLDADIITSNRHSRKDLPCMLDAGDTATSMVELAAQKVADAFKKAI